jgi:hypothetical protein
MIDTATSRAASCVRSSSRTKPLDPGEASGVPTPWGALGLQKKPLDRGDDFALCREATEAVRDNTGTITQSWSCYGRAELDLTIGSVEVLMGWAHTSTSRSRP